MANGSTTGRMAKVTFGKTLGVYYKDGREAYNGDWNEDQPEGRGTSSNKLGVMQYSDGSKYTGEFKNGLPNGKGRVCADV